MRTKTCSIATCVFACMHARTHIHTPTWLICIHYLCFHYKHTQYIFMYRNTCSLATRTHACTHTQNYLLIRCLLPKTTNTHVYVYIINTDLQIIVAHTGVHVNRSFLNRRMHLHRQRLTSAHSITHSGTRVEHTACGRSRSTYLRVFAPESEGR